MGEGAGLLSIDPAIVFLQIVAFVILFLLLRRYLFGPLLGLMQQREKELSDALDAGKRAKAELTRTEEERARVIADAREEGRQQVRQAVQEGEQARERLLQEAREEAQEVRQRAKESVELEREEAMFELRRQVVDLALLAASRAVLSRLDEEKHRQVIDEFIAGMERTE
jgi:F-type H+-transporting ATPase subunit b